MMHVVSGADCAPATGRIKKRCLIMQGRCFSQALFATWVPRARRGARMRARNSEVLRMTAGHSRTRPPRMK